MPRKIKLTWQAGANGRQGRWKKKYRGQTLYLGLANSKSDVAAYNRAYDCWLEEKQRIDAEHDAQPKAHQDEYQQAISDWALALRWALEHDDEDLAKTSRQKISELSLRLESKRPLPLEDGDRFYDQFSLPRKLLLSLTENLPGSSGGKPKSIDVDQDAINARRAILDQLDGSPMRIEREIWKDRLNSLTNTDDTAIENIGGFVDQYLSNEQARVTADELSAGRFTSKRNNVLHFSRWIGTTSTVNAITATRLVNYRQKLLELIGEEKLARDTAHGRLNDVKSFVRWLWRIDAMDEVPRILIDNTHEFSIGKQISTPRFFSLEEIRTLIDAANPRMRLYLLLMLNCAMYQGDISDLLHSEVDWKQGVVSRKRSKTRKHENVPKVHYRLWKSTFELLKKHQDRTTDRVLLNQNGNPLVVRGINDDGEARNNDCVKNAYQRLRKKTGIQKPLKLLRKTSANQIKQNPRFLGLEELFLGLSPQSVSDRHYTDSPQQLLDEAICWLGTQYGLQ